MEILILNWRDITSPLGGGAEISLFEHAKYWQKMGATVLWFSSSYKGARQDEVIEGIRFKRKGSIYTVHLWAFFYFIAGKLGKPALVIDNFHFLPFFTPLYIKRGKIIALINEVAKGLWFSNLFFPLSLVGYTVEPLFFLFYKHVPFITASQSTKEDLVRCGIAEKQITVIPHGITVEPYNADVKKQILTILYLSRISKDKGTKDALEAYKTVFSKDPRVQLWVVGKEEKEGEFQSLLASVYGEDYRIRKSITYFGYVSEKKKFELIQKASVLVHPSQREGWGLTVIECASQGVPTVAYNVEGLRDSVRNGKTGLLTDTNPQALAHGVLHLLSDKTTYERMCIAARKWAQQFDWEKSGKASWELLQAQV